MHKFDWVLKALLEGAQITEFEISQDGEPRSLGYLSSALAHPDGYEIVRKREMREINGRKFPAGVKKLQDGLPVFLATPAGPVRVAAVAGPNLKLELLHHDYEAASLHSEALASVCAGVKI